MTEQLVVVLLLAAPRQQHLLFFPLTCSGLCGPSPSPTAPWHTLICTPLCLGRDTLCGCCEQVDGATVVWDLKKQRPVITLKDPNRWAHIPSWCHI